MNPILNLDIMPLSALAAASHTLFEKLLDKMGDDAVDFIHVTVPKILVNLLLAFVLIRLLSFATRGVMRIVERHSDATNRVQQARTLASVVRATGISIIGFIAGLEILPLIGINLGPLLASAGVAGVAVGLAAQTIVKDVLNGMLILMEDQFNVGDVVTIAGISGFVETMSLRKTSVRGFDGTLYVVPNSQITSTANQSRDFSQTTLNISVDFTADPDKVTALLKKITSDVRNDPAYKDVFIGDPEIQGVDAIKGSEVIYPIVIKTRPRTQYAAIRELQRRLRHALQENQMLPGSPYRILTQNSYSGVDSTAGAPPEPGPKESANPTAAPPIESNPLIAQS
jgi:small conductance mechanosensitive channel